MKWAINYMQYNQNEIVVHVGPSLLSIDKAKSILDVVYRPPARRGDISQSILDGFKIVIIIDGLMIYAYPPSPTEVYSAIQQEDTLVIGASSLGALRAVELNKYGMIGVGWVYQQFNLGLITRDDELLVRINSETNVNLTVPLINIRYGLEILVKRQLVHYQQAKNFFRYLSNVYFEELTRSYITEIALKFCINQKISTFLLSDKFNIKNLDSLSCLRYVKKKFIRN